MKGEFLFDHFTKTKGRSVHKLRQRERETVASGQDKNIWRIIFVRCERWIICSYTVESLGKLNA